MRIPVLSLIAALAFVSIAGQRARSAEVVASPVLAPIQSAPASAAADLVDISGPASASFAVTYYDASGRGELVASGALGGDGLASVITPPTGIGTEGVSFVVVRVQLSDGVEITTRLADVDPMFLWQ